MRLLFDRQELEDTGPPDRWDGVWTLITLPLFIALGGLAAYRLIAVALGRELIISGLLGISHSFDGPILPMIAGLLLYLAILTVALIGLWWCAIQVQRWLYWRDRR